MVKQGKFAQVKQQKHQKYKAKQAQLKQTQTIAPAQMLDFILVRHHLVNQAPALVEQTNGRLLQEFMSLGNGNPWSLRMQLQQTLQQIDVNVPWQFYKIIADSWPQTKAFMLKEIPAIPLAQRIILEDDLSDAQFSELLAQKLSSNWFVNQFKQTPEQLRKTTDAQVEQLAQSFVVENHIDWAKVAELNRTVQLDELANLDRGSQQWLAEVKKYR
ncbi:hypothetical protein D3P96_03725 [Weissella viridescens]|uniref:Uncharacterized protein n=1 Tax=Weissella viridescens TaxID=1629 RepID=A0A3P2RF37_WEIVI|nr:hypothetical protein [Weissella viridescens]RRG18055.1 hypothetical protein D3P96_03725 [Weissella viridescens]